ncbi:MULTISPECIES: hypothetical protein [Halocynthiibacter]|uniref:Uncharacterized protein n=1 Tax=Halocynthiibacter halioticoli TaxID=2986804 RepID=A0AAE3J1N6_9RHOB|nr:MULTISPECIES: hypothetical protein [Halocynthiibacter]MCV6826029.1 hypothetical protein [Halocynthiibacter halioticoli]MCW4059030.1 hypothetical protein [Halocynthiibacter sp. SDUM655004]
MNAPITPDEKIKPKQAELAGLGHNNPPPFSQEKLAGFVERVTEFMKANKAWLDLKQIETDDHAEKATDMIAGLRGLYKEVDTARKAEKKPHDDAGKAVQAAYTPQLDKLKTAADKLKPLIASYIDKKAKAEEEKKRKEEAEAREKARLAEEAAKKAEEENDVGALVEAEAAKKAAEKEAKKASAPVKKSVGSATGAGRTISTRKSRHAVVENPLQVFMYYRDHPDVIDVLTRLATADVRAKDVDETKIPGISIAEKVSAA